ncbi:unnamed protein product [Meganyctiphanes norvegica]|uniref:FAM65 N-terminal domain-containing protein n=1 Tax=Meganyctiphanes norvegica TaxID=48144 RepID=A0AAV2PWU0_MEGNR
MMMRGEVSHAHQQVRVGVELWEIGTPLSTTSHDDSTLLTASSSTPSTGSPRRLTQGTTRSSDSSRSDTSSSGASSSCCSSSGGTVPRRPCLHAALSDPGYESAHPPDEDHLYHPHHRHHHHHNHEGHCHLLPEEEEDAQLSQSVCGMSLRERTSSDGRESSLGQSGLTRSRSFGGLLTHRRSHSGSHAPGTPVPSHRGGIGWGGGQGILGQAGTSPQGRKGSALPPHVKVPKSPRPERSQQVLAAVAGGLREAVTVTRQDLDALRAVHRDVNQQIKAAERYLKRIEYHLSKLEDLHDQYTLHLKLRDGVRTMAYAYALSPGKEKAAALSNVRSGYKECTETLCALEVQIEQLIGTLTLEMKGIQGFARLCPGDVFEVTLKHGAQKWKSRGRVCKDNTQTWDNQRTVIKGLIGEMLLIKAVEVRLLGKTVGIGNKVCETKDLFSPHPQLMTVNLNPSGSLKLNIVITWNPLDGSFEEALVRTPSMSASTATSPGNKRRPPVMHSVSSEPQHSVASVPSGKDGCLSPECDHDSSFGSMSARSSTADSASPLSEYRGLLSSHTQLSNRTDSNSPLSDYQGLTRRTDSQDSILFDGRDSASPQCDNTGNFTLVRKKESRVEQWARYSQFSISQGSNMDLMTRSLSHMSSSSPGQLSPAVSESLSHQLDMLAQAEPDSLRWPDWDRQPPTTLHKVVSVLRTCLEDIQGQFPELHPLEEAVLQLHDICKNCRSRRDSNTSEISLSVESALECFDFLNAECDDDFDDDSVEACRDKKQKESENVLNNVPVVPDANQPLVTGSQQIDTFLFIHLRHSLQLLQHLGSFGPLRCKERHSLRLLEEEGHLVSSVLAHRHNFDSLKPQHIVDVPHVQVLWDSVAGGDDWCVCGTAVVNGLMPVVSALVDPTAPELAKTVLEELSRQMSDCDEYSATAMVTVGHFLHHLREPLQNTIPATATAISIARLLQSNDHSKVAHGLQQLKCPTPHHVKLIGALLCSTQEITNVTNNFINGLAHNHTLLHLIMDSCLLLMESPKMSDRESACVLLSALAPIISTLPNAKDIPQTLENGHHYNKKHSTSSTSSSIHEVGSPSSSTSQEAGTPDWPRPIEVLSFLQQNDGSEEVREVARRSLLSLGSEGQSALQQVQLSTHGFQGVDVKERTKL